jgi:hypothetical protein
MTYDDKKYETQITRKRFGHQMVHALGETASGFFHY